MASRATLVLLLFAPPLVAETPLAEKLAAGTRLTVEVNVTLDGDMTLPGEKPQRLAIAGASKLAYDERSLPADDKDAEKLLRIYRTLEITRVVGDRKQTADIRKEVRRLVVLRTAKAKSPFSPDGPLTWNEIDVVKHDVFAPALAAGLLPNKVVNDGDSWPAGESAVRELTDFEKVTDGALTVKLVGLVTFDGKRRAKLAVSGTLRGVDDNGPARHTLDGTAYFDLDTNHLSYLSVKGTHELLDGEGRTLGRLDGRFTMTRKPGEPESLSDAAIAKLTLTPNAENTRLLYDNADLGIKFVHPRRWRVGAVQGKQVTLDGPNGAGLLITLEPAKSLPTAEAYRTETLAFIAKEKGTTANASPIERTKGEGVTLDRFGFDANLGKDELRMEYAVLTSPAGGATVAARLPRRDAAALTDDVAAVLAGMRFAK